MARINASNFRNWANGDVLTAADYVRERNLLVAAINDTVTQGDSNIFAGNNSFTGVNTFAQAIVQNTAPTLNNHLTTKVYVDAINTSLQTQITNNLNSINALDTRVDVLETTIDDAINNGLTPPNMVTTDTTQTITAAKTFTQPIVNTTLATKTTEVVTLITLYRTMGYDVVECKVETTASITLSGLQTINGVALAVDDVVLVKNQGSTSANGVYLAKTGAWVRHPDYTATDNYLSPTHVTLFVSLKTNLFYSVRKTNLYTFDVIDTMYNKNNTTASVSYLPTLNPQFSKLGAQRLDLYTGDSINPYGSIEYYFQEFVTSGLLLKSSGGLRFQSKGTWQNEGYAQFLDDEGAFAHIYRHGLTFYKSTSTAEDVSIRGMGNGKNLVLDPYSTNSGVVLHSSYDNNWSSKPDNHFTTKTYVKEMVNGLAWKYPCDIATQGNIAATYNNGLGTLTGTPNIVDGVTLTLTTRILVKSQTDAKQNGIYNVQTVGTGSNGVWNRSVDANEPAELVNATVFVQQGTDAEKQYTCTFNTGQVIGTDNINFILINVGGAAYTGTAPINVSGTVISLNDDGITDTKMGTDVKIGSLAALTTTTKVSIQAAINELVTNKANLSGATFTGAVTFNNGATINSNTNIGTASSTVTIAGVNVNINGASSSSASTANIGNHTGTGTKLVNIGNNATGGAATVNIGGALSTTTLAGVVNVPTPTTTNNPTTKDYVDTALALKANLASPALTGTPTAPTPTTADNSTTIATTAYVKNNLSSYISQNEKNVANGVPQLDANALIDYQLSAPFREGLFWHDDFAGVASFGLLGANGASTSSFNIETTPTINGLQGVTTSATLANSGATRFFSPASTQLTSEVRAGAKVWTKFFIPSFSNPANMTYYHRFGFTDAALTSPSDGSATAISTDVANGVYLRIVNDVATLVIRNEGSETASSNFTITRNQWYHIVLEVTSNASATCKIYTINTTVNDATLGQFNLADTLAVTATINLGTATSVKKYGIHFSACSTMTPTGTQQIIRFDYIGAYVPRASGVVIPL